MRSTFCGLAASLLLLVSCSKDPGEGGRAEIRGRVLEQRYSSNTGQPVGQPYALAEKDVYIIYGDGTYHDDDVTTGADGTFRFTWLRKGSYTVYTISECGSYDGCTVSVVQQATIDERKAQVQLGDFTVQNW
jgi:hypothetical protein